MAACLRNLLKTSILHSLLAPALVINRPLLCMKGFNRHRFALGNLSAYSNDSKLSNQPKHIVKLGGLKWDIKESDIISFLNDCEVDSEAGGIHMVTLCDGRPSGTAFVAMKSERDVQLSLRKHKKYLMDRYVEVSEANEAIVVLKGLPYKLCSAPDVQEFFKKVDMDIPAECIHFPVNQDQRSTGEAFVVISDPMQYSKVFQLHNQTMGTSTRKIYLYEGNQHQMDNLCTNPGDMKFPLMVRGLPYDASVKDIEQFFEPYELSSVKILYNDFGKPSGMASVDFTCKEDRNLARREKNNEYLGKRFIELRLPKNKIAAD